MSFDAAALLDWYERVRRPLPWRATRDPYALLVSEVMLQQTQAARVVPYYRAFLERFPDPEALAAAPAPTCSPRGAASATTGARWRSSGPPARSASAAGRMTSRSCRAWATGRRPRSASFAWDPGRGRGHNVPRDPRHDGAAHAPRALAGARGGAEARRAARPRSTRR